MARYLSDRCVAAITMRHRKKHSPLLNNPLPLSNDPAASNVVEVSPYLCRPTRHFDLMVGPYQNLPKAHLRRRQIRKFDAAPGILRVIKVPSGYWVVRQIERRE